MTDPIRRALRTFAQGFVGVLAIAAVGPLNDLVTGVVSGAGSDVTIDLSLWRNIALAAIAGGVIALISWAQNRLEDKQIIPDTRG